LEQTESIYNLALSFLSGVSDVNVKRLISKYKTSKEIFALNKSDIIKTHGIGEYTATKMIGSMSSAITKAEEELKYLIDNDLNYVTILDDDDPNKLKNCDDAPIVLYYKGYPNLNADKIISVVGTRKATRYGTEFCENIISKLAEKYPEIIIVSGLAYGIDIAAHTAALDNNLETWAVLGHSLQSIYPAAHRNIAKQIIESKGAIFSDFPHNSVIDPANFIKRNRIVAGLCDALIIVESDLKGGALVTANIANSYNKDVFAVPGNLNAKYSSGCNNLIKTNRANLIESVEDIEYIMSWDTKVDVKNAGKKDNLLKLFSDFNDNEKTVVQILQKHEFLDIDNLKRQSQLDANTLSLTLLELEFSGVVRAMPGKIFSLKK
jgi:DNA processing protein